MYKYVAALVRSPEVTHEEFVDHWQTIHTPTVPGIAGVVRYHTVLPTDPEHSEFDGIAELYFEDLGDLHDALGRPGSRDSGATNDGAGLTPADDADVLAIDGGPRFIGQETIQKNEVGTDTTGLFKHSAFLVRQPGLSHEEFVDYWQSTHTPIARDIEGVVRYHTVIPTDPEQAEFDGIAELYFEELADLHDALGSPGSRDYDPTKDVAARARADVDNFLAIDQRPRFIGQETVQLNATGDIT